MDACDACVLQRIGRHSDPWSFDNFCIALGADDSRPPRSAWTGLHDLLDISRVQGACYLKESMAHWTFLLNSHGLLHGRDFALLTLRARSSDCITWMCASEEGNEIVSCVACPIEHADAFDLMEDDTIYFKATFRLQSELIEMAASGSLFSVIQVFGDTLGLSCMPPLYQRFKDFCATLASSRGLGLQNDMRNLKEKIDGAASTLARQMCDTAEATSVNLELQVEGMTLEAGYRAASGRSYAAWNIATQDLARRKDALLALTVDSVNYIEVFGPRDASTPKRICATRGLRALEWSPQVIEQLALSALWMFGWPNTIVNATSVPTSASIPHRAWLKDSFGFSVEDL